MCCEHKPNIYGIARYNVWSGEKGGLMREIKGSDRDEKEKTQREGEKASCLVTEARGEKGERR